MRPKPGRRPRHPLTDLQEHRYLLAGSRLFNRRQYYDAHEEWEEVWRRAAGSRRELLRGLIQVCVGYEHLKRGNHFGAGSLLRQGIRRLRPHRRVAGVRELVARATQDVQRLQDDPSLTLARLRPPKVLVRLRGRPLGGRVPARALQVEVPPARPGRVRA